jgi:glyoxylase-like metal-dependent hydrolase (beta-lactamase superfamily II)
VHLDYGGERFTMLVDTRTMLPSEIDRTVANQMLGDVVLSNEFPKWYVTSGIRLPIEIIQRIDEDWKLSDLELDGVKVDGEIPDISAPESVKNTKLEFFPLVVSVDSAAPGVWFLAGGSHNSVVIEMKDHLLLVEAPQSDERTLAVIQKAQSLRPDKPLRAVINTHHHFDHAGGIRAAISQGLTIYTHAENKPFFEDLARRKFTLIPDQLSKSPRRATIEPVIAKRSLRDATRTVELYEVRGSQHSASMLMVYLPAEKILIEADLFTPPAPNITPMPPMPFAKDLIREIDRQGLTVETILPLHGRIVPMSFLRGM